MTANISVWITPDSVYNLPFLAMEEKENISKIHNCHMYKNSRQMPWDRVIASFQEVWPVRWRVDMQEVAQVPSEIGRAPFSITSSEASNGSQHVIKRSLRWCECWWTQVSVVFFLNTVFCVCINNEASLLISLKCTPICARLLRACLTVGEHRADCSVQLSSCRQGDMQPLRRKKSNWTYVWIYMAPSLTACMRQGTKHNDRKYSPDGQCCHCLSVPQYCRFI